MADEKAKKAWAKKHGLKEQTQYPFCVHEITGRKCKHEYRGICSCGPSIDFCTPPHGDHESMWLKDGKPHVFVSQPYGLSHNKLMDILQYCEMAGLELTITSYPAWYYPGHVLFLEFRAAGEKPTWEGYCGFIMAERGR